MQKSTNPLAQAKGNEGKMTCPNSNTPHGYPSVWETLAVEALAWLSCSTAEMVLYVTDQRGVTVGDFPRMYRPAFGELVTAARALVAAGQPLDRVDMVQLGQCVQERQGYAGTRVWQRITGHEVFNAVGVYGMAEITLVDGSLSALIEQAGYNHAGVCIEALQGVLDTSNLDTLEQAKPLLEKALDARNRAGHTTHTKAVA